MGWLVGSIIGVFVFFCALCGISYVVNEWEFSKIPPVEVECTQLRSDFVPSTLRTHIAPVMSSDGKFSAAVYTTGHAEKRVTIWDCGKYGRLISERGDVYRYGTEKSILYIRHNNYDTRIVGIKNVRE